MTPLLGAFLLMLAGAQQGQMKARPTPSGTLGDSAPVTGNEAAKVFSQARAILSKVLKMNLGQSSVAPSPAPVSREQIVAEMAAIRKAYEPAVKFTPRPAKFSPQVFRIRAAQMGNLKLLVALGYVGKVSPLATGPRDTMTVSEFGEALGFFLARSAEVTHMPSPKWSPILGAGS